MKKDTTTGFLFKLFGSGKPKETYPICGQPTDFFSETELTDRAACGKCVARAVRRGTPSPVKRQRR